MRPAHLKQVLCEIILKTNITPLIWGSRGIGKSQIVASLTKDLENVTGEPWGLVDLRISTQEISDLTGIPKTYTWKAYNVEEGKDAVITETDWSVPSWFPTIEKIDQKERNIPKNGIIFLDEINRGGPQETQALFQFVLDKRIHTHKLATGWKIIAAANPPTEEYLVNDFDSALLDRFLQLILKPDAYEWLVWAKSSEGKISEKITRYINTRPEMLFEIGESEISWSPTITSSPRSWEALNIIMENCKLPSEVEIEVFAGLVGYIPAISFIEFLKTEYEKPIQAIDIMKNYIGVRNRIIDVIAGNRVDYLNITIQDIINLANTTPQEFNIENFYDFFMDLRNDIKVTLVHALMEIDGIYTQMNNHDGLVLEITRIMEEVEKNIENNNTKPYFK